MSTEPIKLLPDSPEGKRLLDRALFPKRTKTLDALEHYKVLEVHDDGDLTIQLLREHLTQQGVFVPTDTIIVVTTDGQTFKEEMLAATINLLAETEGDPLRKFCCRQCGECASAEFLEEGKFPERMAWLRSHYKTKHPGMWGKVIHEGEASFYLGKELEPLVPGFEVIIYESHIPKSHRFDVPVGSIDDKKKRITIILWKGAIKNDALVILAHEYAHIKPGTTTFEKGIREGQVWERGAAFAMKWGVLPEYRRFAQELADEYEKHNLYPNTVRQIRQWLAHETSEPTPHPKAEKARKIEFLPALKPYNPYQFAEYVLTHNQFSENEIPIFTGKAGANPFDIPDKVWADTFAKLGSRFVKVSDFYVIPITEEMAIPPDMRARPEWKSIEELLGESQQPAVIPTEPELSLSTINLLADTEGDPIRKFCCRQCGECAPKELLEEGRFPDRIAWLRSHYKAKHPGMWGGMQADVIPTISRWRRVRKGEVTPKIKETFNIGRERDKSHLEKRGITPSGKPLIGHLAMDIDYLKELREVTEKLRRLDKTIFGRPPIPEDIEEQHDRLIVKQREVARRALSKECWDVGIVLFDANCFLEQAGSQVEYEEYERALDSLDEARSYYSIASGRGYITTEEHKEMERYLDEASREISRRRWLAGFRVGDADRLAKSLLFNKLVECECKKR